MLESLSFLCEFNSFMYPFSYCVRNHSLNVSRALVITLHLRERNHQESYAN